MNMNTMMSFMPGPHDSWWMPGVFALTIMPVLVVVVWKLLDVIIARTHHQPK